MAVGTICARMESSFFDLNNSFYTSDLHVIYHSKGFSVIDSQTPISATLGFIYPHLNPNKCSGDSRITVKLLAAVQSEGFDGSDRKYLSWLGVERKWFCVSLQPLGGTRHKPNMLSWLYMQAIDTR